MNPSILKKTIEKHEKAMSNNETLEFSVDIDKKAHSRFKKQARKEAIKKQRELVQPDNDMYKTYKEAWDNGEVYAGAIGGQFSYEISHTSLGATCVIKCNLTNMRENLTNFDLW